MKRIGVLRPTARKSSGPANRSPPRVLLAEQAKLITEGRRRSYSPQPRHLLRIPASFATWAAVMLLMWSGQIHRGGDQASFPSVALIVVSPSNSGGETGTGGLRWAA